MVNEIAIIEQLPVITEKIKEIGENLDKRLSDLNLDKLICNDETRKSVADLRSTLNKEKTVFEKQRKEIKSKILAPYEEFEKTYNLEIKKRYEEAIYLLDTKIDIVESGIKDNTKDKMISFFEEYKQSKNIPKDYLRFEELGIKVGITQLTTKGDLVKKVKDEIIDSVNTVSTCIETIKTMENSDEILVEYLKTKNLSQSIKEVNDRHMILNQVQRDYEMVQEEKKQEGQAVEKVEEVLQAPIEEEIKGQMSIDDFGEEEQANEELLEARFKVITSRENLKYLVSVMKERGMKYESITE